MTLAPLRQPDLLFFTAYMIAEEGPSKRRLGPPVEALHCRKAGRMWTAKSGVSPAGVLWRLSEHVHEIHLRAPVPKDKFVHGKGYARGDSGGAL